MQLVSIWIGCGVCIARVDLAEPNTHWKLNGDMNRHENVCIVQDYHLFLVPQMLRRKRDNMLIQADGHFESLWLVFWQYLTVLQALPEPLAKFCLVWAWDLDTGVSCGFCFFNFFSFCTFYFCCLGWFMINLWCCVVACQEQAAKEGLVQRPGRAAWQPVTECWTKPTIRFK